MKHERLSPKLQMILDTRSRSISEELMNFQRSTLRDASRDSCEPSAELGLSDKELRSYSINDAARAFSSRDGFTGLEADCHQQLVTRYGPARNAQTFYVPADVLRHASRSMSASPGQKGGFLVDVSIASFADQLQNASVATAMGVQTLEHPTGNVIVVKQLSGPTFVWLGPPGTSATASDPAFGQLGASPKTIVSVTEISAQAQYQIGPVAEYFTRRNLALGIASGIDQAIIAGTGGLQPLGIANTPTINTVAGAAIDRAKIVDLQTQAANQNAIVEPQRQGYIAPPTTAALLAGRQEYTGVASTLWKGSIARGEMAGVPAMSTKSMAAGTILFGDFSQVLLVQFGPLQIAVHVADFTKASLAIRALSMIDVVVIEPKSFTLATSVT